MHSKLLQIFAISASVIGASAVVHAQQSTPVDVGKFEYDAHCSACHGPTGKGDGHFALLLKSDAVLLNLTELSKKNNGTFPFARVYETIDGTVLVRAHGPKEMPIWGQEYKIKSYELNPNYVSEEFVRAKILALTEYVYRLQAK